jgi:hypothetical protein
MNRDTLKKLQIDLKVHQECMDANLYHPRDKEKELKKIEAILEQIKKEEHRLLLMKESGEVEEYVIPKRNAARQQYSDPHTLADNDMDTSGGMSDNSDTENMDFDETDADSDTESATESDEEEKNSNADEADDEWFFSEKGRSRSYLQSPDPDVYHGDRNDY